MVMCAAWWQIGCRMPELLQRSGPPFGRLAKISVRDLDKPGNHPSLLVADLVLDAKMPMVRIPSSSTKTVWAGPG